MPAFCRGWCAKHYQSWRTKGAPVSSSAPHRGKPCTVEDCDQPNRGNGYCLKHYTRLRRRGSTDLIPRPVVHHLSDVDKENLTGVCVLCGPVEIKRVGKNQQRLVCKPSYNLGQKLIERKSRLKEFGLTLEDYELMMKEQDGVCYLCKKECATGRSLAMDHSHKTGKLRRLLCSNCNRGLGNFQDDPVILRAAADYVEVA